MTSRDRKSTVIQAAPTAVDSRLDRVILWITLGALLFIPLLFSYFKVVSVFGELRLVLLHFAAGSVASLSLWQIVSSMFQKDGTRREDISWDLSRWAGSSAARWTIVAVVIFSIVQTASTLLSLLPIISFFGGDDARSGYNLYDSLSMTVLLFSVAFRFRTLRHLEFLAYVLVSSGTVAATYGLAQHFGWDPIGGNADQLRPIASFGNTLNFSAYMVMSIPATMAIWHIRSKRSPSWMAAITLALGCQLAGIWSTGSRGPYIGAAVGIIVFFVIASLLLKRRDVLKAVAVTFIATIIAVIITTLPSPKGNIGLVRAISISGQLDRDSSAVSTDIAGGLSGRFSIWRSTLDLSTRWDMPVDEPTINSALRPLFGVGPDLFVYAFPQVGEPQSALTKVEHAHNLTLNTLVELGYLGLISLTAITLLVLLAGFRTVVVARRMLHGTNKTSILVLAILPSLVGKLVEVQTGVSRVSDMAMMFALVGAVIALHEVVRRSVPSGEVELPSKQSSTAVTTSRPVFIGSMLVAAILVSAMFLTLFISWDVRRTAASRLLATTYDHPDILTRTYGWQDSQAQAPERESFTVPLFKQYIQVANEQKALGNEEDAVRMVLQGRQILIDYEHRDPFELDVQLGLSRAATMMTEWGYHEYAQEMADRYIRLVELYPYFPGLFGTAATAMSSLGLHELAIEYADRAIATEATTKPWSKAWFAKGRSLYETGFEDEAIEALITAIEKEPDSEGATLAHQFLADIYETRGDIEEAEYHGKLGKR